MDLNLKIYDIINEAKAKLPKLIAIVFSIIGFALIYLVFLYPPIFKSSATIVYSGNKASSISSTSSNIMGSFGLSLPSISGTPSPEIVIQILNSDSFARTMVQKQFFSEKFSREISLYNIILDDVDITATNEYLYQAKTHFKQETLLVSKDRLTNVINIVIQTKEAKLSYDIALEVLSLLNKSFNIKEQTRANEKASFIEERLLFEQEKLSSLEREYIEFQNNNKSISQSPALKMKEKSIERELGMVTGIVSMLMQQLELTKLEFYDELNEVMVISEPEIMPFRSNRRLYLAIGSAFFGALVAIFYLLIGIIFKKNKNTRN